MKIGSHNSMSFLHDRRWWMRPFESFARCQKANLLEQITFCDMLDFRVNFDKNGEVYFCHGAIHYKNWYGRSCLGVLEYVANLCNRIHKEMRIRVILESNKEESEDKKEIFHEFVKSLPGNEYISYTIKYKTPWTTLYEDNDFGCVPFVDICQHFGKGERWKFLLTPRYWAHRNNGRRISELAEEGFDGIIFMDFV